jgi:hypothetical protein
MPQKIAGFKQSGLNPATIYDNFVFKMRKAAILSITAFYLLVTTGMFVCIVHCATESFVAKPAMPMAGLNSHCKSEKDCDCCKKHGNYFIKENLKPGFNIQFSQTAVLIPQIQIIDFLLNAPRYNTTSWEDSNAPPGKSGKAISIKFHSLLI